MTDSEAENWERVRWSMDNEGFDYCFTGYSNWTEIEDSKFQELKEAYCNSQKELEKYIMDKYEETLISDDDIPCN